MPVGTDKELGVPVSHLGVVDGENKKGHFENMRLFFECVVNGGSNIG